MKRKTLILIILLLACAAKQNIFAQNDTPHSDYAKDTVTPITFGFFPQYLAVNGTRLMLEVPVKKPNYRIAIMPTFYSGNSNSRYKKNDGLPAEYASTEKDGESGGIGTDIIFKYYTSSIYRNCSECLFAGFGLGYHHIIENFQEYAFRNYIQDGIGFWQYKLGAEKEVLTRYDIILVTGSNIGLNEILSVEMSIGAVYRFGNMTTTLEKPREEVEYFYRNMGWKFRFTFGVCLNFPLKKSLGHNL